LSRISELLASPVPVEVTSPIHRSSVKFRIDSSSSSSSRSRIVSPPAVNDTTPARGSDDLRFISTKSLNLQPVTPQTAQASALSPPLKGSNLPSGTATIPSAGSSKRRPPQKDAVPTGRPQRYQSTEAFVLTSPDVAAPPDVISPTSVGRVSTSSRRTDEKCIDEDWQKIVAAASSDQINLVSFHDTADMSASYSDAASYTSSTVPRHSAAYKASNPGTVIFTLQASPPVKGRSSGVTLRSIQDVCVRPASPAPSPVPSQPLSFANPLYSHGAKVDTSQRSKTAAAETESSMQSSEPSSNVGFYSRRGTREASGKRPHALPLASASIGVARSRRYRDLAGSTESLDSVLASRPSSKSRHPSLLSSLCDSPRFSQSTSHIEHPPLPIVPRWPPRGNFETSPHANTGIKSRETDFGALKRLWQSIELPASPSTSTGSSQSYQSPARHSQSRIGPQGTIKHLHSTSFDAGLPGFPSSKSTRRGHSCDSLLSGPTTHQSNKKPASADVEDQSEVLLLLLWLHFLIVIVIMVENGCYIY